LGGLTSWQLLALTGADNFVQPNNPVQISFYIYYGTLAEALPLQQAGMLFFSLVAMGWPTLLAAAHVKPCRTADA
jgi:hypothetical protein